MDILTALGQLEGKTVKHISYWDDGQGYMLITTEDDKVLYATFEPRKYHGVDCLYCHVENNKLTIVEELDDMLVEYGILTEEGFEELQCQVSESEKARKAMLEKENRERELAELSRLKAKYESDTN